MKISLVRIESKVYNNYITRKENVMKKELLLIIALVCFTAGGLSACCHKEVCPPCQTVLGQAQYVPQAAAVPAEESQTASRRTAIK